MVQEAKPLQQEGTKGAPEGPQEDLGEAEKLFDRQIRLWGLEAQKKYTQTHACMHACMRTYACMQAAGCMQTHAYRHVLAWIHVCRGMQANSCMHAGRLMHACMHTWMQFVSVCFVSFFLFFCY